VVVGTPRLTVLRLSLLVMVALLCAAPVTTRAHPLKVVTSSHTRNLGTGRRIACGNNVDHGKRGKTSKPCARKPRGGRRASKGPRAPATSVGSVSGEPLDQSVPLASAPLLDDPPAPGESTAASESPDSPEGAAPPELSPGGRRIPFRFFSQAGFWNEPVPADAPLDQNSSAIMTNFDSEIVASESSHGGPTINTTSWSVPVYTVPAEQPTLPVKLESGGSPALQAAWAAVPLPPNAEPAAGSDKHLVVWQPSTNRLWEFWRLIHTIEGWQASWGGAMQKVSSNPGVYGPEAWPNADLRWGGSASSLSLAGGLITLEDLEDGAINHALAIAIPNVRVAEYSSPAHRTDGESTNPLSLPEGAHLRLDPSLALAKLHLPPLTLMIAEAAQRYGIFVRSRGSSVAFYGQDPTPTGTDPYAGRDGYFQGKTGSQILASFPWSHLELLKMELSVNS
jgi:hypothetical protein